MPAVRIPCSACHGHGEVELPAPHQQTLERLGDQWRSTGDVLHRHGSALTAPARTALVNRLHALVRWGFVERRGAGRSVEWRRI
jgi:hypothetical protein